MTAHHEAPDARTASPSDLAARLPTTTLEATTFRLGGPRMTAQGLVSDEPGNRWNAAGEAAVYLAGDIGVAIVEAGRHVELAEDAVHMTVWAVPVRAERIADVRTARARQVLGLDERSWFLDRRRCQLLATRLRRAGMHGLIAPCAGSPDDTERWNLVLFDGHGPSLDRLVSQARAIGSLDIRSCR